MKDYNSVITKLNSNPQGLAIKDLFHLKDVLTTGGIESMSTHISLYNAEALEGLLEFLEPNSKDNLDELGIGSKGYSSLAGQVRYGNKRLGGSSTGTALEVALGRSLCGLCSDTGGSAREVVFSHKDLIGFKPSYGLISRFGLIPHSNFLDTVSIVTRSRKTLFRALIKAMKNRRKDTTLSDLRDFKFRAQIQVGRKFLISPYSVSCVKTGRKHMTKILNPYSIKRCYHYWSSIYVYSNLQRFFSKAFKGENWLHRAQLNCPKFAFETRKRYLFGQAYLNLDGGQGKIHFKMVRERDYLKRFLDLLSWKGGILMYRTLDLRLGKLCDWTMPLGNLTKSPVISLGRWCYQGGFGEDFDLLRLKICSLRNLR